MGFLLLRQVFVHCCSSSVDCFRHHLCHVVVALSSVLLTTHDMPLFVVIRPPVRNGLWCLLPYQPSRLLCQGAWHIFDDWFVCQFRFLKRLARSSGAHLRICLKHSNTNLCTDNTRLFGFCSYDLDQPGTQTAGIGFVATHQRNLPPRAVPTHSIVYHASPSSIVSIFAEWSH